MLEKEITTERQEKETDPLVCKKLEHFQDMKFGLMIHWGIYSVWGAVESWPICDKEPYGRESLAQWDQAGQDVETFLNLYFDLNQQFNPTQFDPDAWATAAQDAGMKYLVFTTKHHDGFCMYDSHQTDYRTTHASCPFHENPKADIVKVLFDAFRQRDFSIGAYYSKADWHCPSYWNPDYPRLAREVNYDPKQYPEHWADYVSFVHHQIQELMTGYGPIYILWLDSDWVKAPLEDIHMPELVQMAREHQPGLIVVNRAVGGRYENYKTPELTVPETFVEGIWESCLIMGQQWSYKPDDQFKSTRELIHTLVRIVARGGNLLLNIGPDPQGRLPEEALARLKEIGQWIRVNGEAIYGTRAIAPYEQGQVCLTQKDDVVYAIVLAAEGQATPPVNVTVSCVKEIQSVRLLGSEQRITYHLDQKGLTLTLPDKLPCEHAWAFALNGAVFQERNV